MKSEKILGMKLGSTKKWLNPFGFGKAIHWPLNIISGILYAGSTITNPEFYAGIYNYVIKGGIYHGDKLQGKVRDGINQYTKKAIEALIEKTENQQSKETVLSALKKIPSLIDWDNSNIENEKIELKLGTNNITFSHFHQLSLIENSGFKDVFQQQLGDPH